jgi:hypothetical protein
VNRMPTVKGEDGRRRRLSRKERRGAAAMLKEAGSGLNRRGRRRALWGMDRQSMLAEGRRVGGVRKVGVFPGVGGV